MKTRGKMLLLYVICLLIISCKKNTGNEPSEISTSRIPDNRSRIAALTKEVAEVLQQVYADIGSCNEVFAAIFSGYYEDERVLLKDLLNPAGSELYRAPAFQIFKVDTGRFRKKFCEIIEKGNYPLLNSELRYVPVRKINAAPSFHQYTVQLDDAVVGVLSGGQLISIYFPYSENFANFKLDESIPPDNKLAIIKKPTLVHTDRDADFAPGKAPYYCPGKPNNLCYINVNVDDNYAEARPTHIVTIGARIRESLEAAVTKPELVSRVYHGSSKLVRQMDKLISFTGNGGGSEIKVCRINGYLRRTDEQISDFAGDIVTLYYTRADISKKRWKRVYSIWDPNWNYQDIEQIYAVYEDDNNAVKTISGALTTTLSLPANLGKAEGDIGFKIQVTTQDEIITQRKLDRKSYFRDGQNNQGWGFLPDPNDFHIGVKDWPVIDGGSIWQYTIPYRIY